MSHVYTRTERIAFFEHGSVQLRASVAADGDEDRASIRVLRHNSGSQTFDEIHLMPKVSELREFLGEIERLARENRGEAA